jgi:hypothetical protein
MNRLVIIGNGFDLAHGLPTSYKHFIDDFWKNFKDKCKNDEYSKLITAHDLYNGYYNGYKPIENFNDFKVNLKTYSKENGHYFDLTNFVCKCQSDVIFKFNNDFFRFICDNSIENWVDIENEYYKKLKIIVKLASLTNNEKKYQTIILNKEFEQVKNLLEKYLKEKVEYNYDFCLFRDNPIKDILLPELESRFDQKKYLKEFQYCDQTYVKEFLEKSKSKYELITHFLNFNYTKVGQLYFDEFPYEKQLNYIHGKLNISDNKVNFGFGDEMDEDYKIIENINDNEYLRNFKSFQYLQNSNYKKLLDFVESDQKFQVYIFGHSCGLSDRTLLNTIFEHQNCMSIKIFCHKYKEKKSDGSLDNYTEIVQNISRHFDNKKLMRSKIVNKELCVELPQDVRFNER